MMYPPFLPWAGWCGLWAPPLMPFHLRWSGPAGGFDHGGYYTGDDYHGGVSQQHDRMGHRQENRIV
jgi:hypothetical protein